MSASSDDVFQVEWFGDRVVVSPAAAVEQMRWELLDHAAQAVMAPLRQTPIPKVVLDLSRVQYFGTVFLSLILRCHKHIKTHGGTLVLCGANSMIRELFKITVLDTLWQIYDTRDQALEALGK
ncbi:MAG: STAS domain-containing protein [Planctomycetales bacterium]